MLPIHLVSLDDRINIVSNQFHSYVGSPKSSVSESLLKLNFQPEFEIDSNGIRLIVDVQKMDKKK